MKLFRIITKAKIVNMYSAAMSEQNYFVANNLKELLENIEINIDDISEIIELSDNIKIINVVDVVKQNLINKI